MFNHKYNLENIIEKELDIFLEMFLANPYLCYTEHGIHAFFYQHLYSALPEEYRSLNIPVIGLGKKIEDIRMCRIQKEYPTHGTLGKGRRQNWDIAVIRDIDNSETKVSYDYDHLPLCSIIEFGLNSNLMHLIDDFLRVRHQEANTDSAFLVHLCRFSGREQKRISSRDLSYKSQVKPWKDNREHFLYELGEILNDEEHSYDCLKDKIEIFIKDLPDKDSICIEEQLTRRNAPRKQKITTYFGMVNLPEGESVLWKHNDGIWKIKSGKEWWPK